MNRLRWAWERLTLYLPVLLMGVLAMATYWLVRSTPITGSPAAVPAVHHQPDYFMRQFAVKTFGEHGQLKSEVKGGEARHFPDTDTLEIDRVVILSYDKDGHLTTATAHKALTNGDGSEVTLMGDALVQRAATISTAGKEQPALTFKGEQLHAFINTEQVHSNLPVTLTRGQDQFTADRMDFDNRKQVIALNGHVKGVLFPDSRR
ncbi:LPS export ABC transporter periplasmic protein LptC [Rhodoferax sp.]|uniref:LPS export ABC transporter periplasmic protein LptC n=1 Tax=Rhodoferax sp. TaxID=50421 RepID=UPI00283BAFC4|nr:LPS export ABC transporter periplasmic protein LptC [Rhodoferax sp.]MDR3371985.1 LPS export ABC transporter periplasmic protein LptC [Rhodoferax sp.]